MKKQDITYLDKLNELKLDVKHPNNKGIVFIFVEGQSDIRLFRKFFDLKVAKVENIPGGKFKLEECVEELLKKYNLILGIRDADFIHLNKTPYTKPNIFITDFHDIEILLIYESEVFSSLLFEFSDVKKEQHLQLREEILKSIEKISLLKWLNELENLEMNFELGFQDLISFKPLSFDFPQFFNRLVHKSPNIKIKDIAIIESKIDGLLATNPDPFQLCNGHDFLKALSQFLRLTANGNGINIEILSSLLRAIFRLEFLKRTILFEQTNNWAKSKGCTIYLT